MLIRFVNMSNKPSAGKLLSTRPLERPACDRSVKTIRDIGHGGVEWTQLA
jgi:hypothetical protein